MRLSPAGHSWHDLFEDRGDSSFEFKLESIRSNPEFENIIVNRMVLLNSTRKRFVRVQNHIREILNFIKLYYTF